MNPQGPSPHQTKPAGKRIYKQDHWTLKKNQDLSEAVVGPEQPSKMIIDLVGLKDVGQTRKLYYKENLGEKFKWYDEIDVGFLNDWRKDKIRKYTPRGLRKATEVRAIKKPVPKTKAIREQAAHGHENRGAELVGMKDTIDSSESILSILSHGRETRAFRVQKLRSARIGTSEQASSGRQNSSSSKEPIGLFPGKFDNVVCFTPEQLQRHQKIQHRSWNTTFDQIQRSFDDPSRDIGVIYNL